MSEKNKANEKAAHEAKREEQHKDHASVMERIEEDLKEFGNTETSIMEDTFNGIDVGKTL